MILDEAIKLLNRNLLHCEICEIFINEKSDFVYDTQGKKPMVTCHHCHIIRQAFKSEGLQLP